MATVHNNLSEYNIDKVPDGTDYTIALVVSEWNENITGNLLKGAYDTLVKHNVDPTQISVYPVPGTYELPIGCQMALENRDYDAVVAIGSVIQGETKHFDFVCESTANGVREVSLKYNIPVIFCVLTDDTLQQAIDRSGGKHGNKGIECAVAALKMASLQKQMK